MSSFEEQKQRFHPRSPVQPERSTAPYFLAAVVGALAIWTVGQIWMQDRNQPSPEQARTPVPSRGNASRIRVIERIEGAETGSKRGDVRTVFSSEDYPLAAIRNNEQGTAQARLDIDEQGRVTACTIVRSAGATLDAATCNILRRRAQFTPARDTNGHATSDSVVTPPITWRLEG